MENKITLQELTAMLALESGEQKNICEAFLSALQRIVVEELEQGGYVRINGFGTFKTIRVEARKSVNVSTGNEFEIPEHRKVIFVAGRELAALTNAPFNVFKAVEISEDFPLELLDKEIDVEENPEFGEPEAEYLEAEVASGEPEAEVAETKETEEAEESEVILQTTGEEKPVDKEPEEEESEGALDEEPEERPGRFRFAKGFLVGFVAAIVIVSGVVLALYYSGVFHKKTQNEEAIAHIEQAAGEAPDTEGEDEQMTVLAENAGGEAQEASLPEEDAVPTKASDTEPESEEEKKEEVVYDTVTETHYLTKIAKKHYGNFNLWPIIYEENKAILGHPDRIKPGTRVVVPPLSKYNVDPHDEATIKEIKRKGVAIYARFKK